MASASDKSRFYLERSVSELQELRRKEIFTQHEVSCIVKARSDFEHKINGRGSHASDYAKYAAYEMNLDSLRQKRTKRLGIKAIKFSGQRNVFFILERATRRFHGDKGLWMQYVSFARRQKSNKKVSEILTQMLRLFPTEPDIWTYAATYALEVRGDMDEARTYMQKGLRLCKNSETLWVEYARVELIHIAKLEARRKVLGLNENGIERNQSIESYDNACDDILDQPRVTAKGFSDGDKRDDGPDGTALRKSQLDLSRAGAIPIAIFDAALEESKDHCPIAWAFFDMVAETEVAPRRVILNHIMDCMQSIAPSRAETLIRLIKQPIIGVDARSKEFPMSLAVSLDKYHAAVGKLETMPCRRRFYEDMEAWITKLLGVKDLDDDIYKVLRALLKKTQSEMKTIEEGSECAWA